MLQIAIIYNSIRYYLDLDVEMSIRIKQEAQIWEFDKLKMSHSLPIDIPKTTNNQRILSFPGIQDENTYHCVLYWNTILQYEGELQIEEAGENYYRASISMIESGLREKLYLNMSEIDIYGGKIQTGFTGPESQDAYDFGLPRMYMGQFLNGTEYDFLETEYVNEHLELYGDETTGYWHGLEYENHIGSYGTKYYPIVPCPYVYNTLEYIANWLGLELEAEVFRTGKLRNLMFTVFKSIDNTAINESAGTISYYDIYPFDLQNVMPDISVLEFLKTLRRTFGLGLSIGGGKLRLYEMKPVLEDNEITDWSDRLMSISYPYNEREAGVLAWTDDSEEVVKETEYKAGEGQEWRIETGAVYLPMEGNKESSSNATGICDYTDREERGEVRFLFQWRWVFADDADGDGELEYYPKLAGTQWNADNSVRLKIDDSIGLYPVFWDKIFDIVTGRRYTAEATLKLSQRDVLLFDQDRKYKVGDDVYYIESLEFNVDVEGEMGLVKAKMIKVV